MRMKHIDKDLQDKIMAFKKRKCTKTIQEECVEILSRYSILTEILNERPTICVYQTEKIFIETDGARFAENFDEEGDKPVVIYIKDGESRCFNDEIAQEILDRAGEKIADREVAFVCQIHGSFEVTIKNYREDEGCPDCDKNQNQDQIKINTIEQKPERTVGDFVAEMNREFVTAAIDSLKADIFPDVDKEILDGALSFRENWEGVKQWIRHGKLHRNDRPALIDSDGAIWYQHGEYHRDVGPALIANGEMAWYQHGVLHRDGGPAEESAYCGEKWYQNGKLHRDGGPAHILPSGEKAWYQNDKLHRVDGPAVTSSDGIRKWYLNGEELAFEEWLDRIECTEIRRKILRIKKVRKSFE
jgi:hypothetical protein